MGSGVEGTEGPNRLAEAEALLGVAGGMEGPLPIYPPGTGEPGPPDTLDVRRLALDVAMRSMATIRLQDRRAAAEAGTLPSCPDASASPDDHQAYIAAVRNWNNQTWEWGPFDQARALARDGTKLGKVATHLRLMNNTASAALASRPVIPGVETDTPRARYQDTIALRLRERTEHPKFVDLPARRRPDELRLGAPLVVSCPTASGKKAMQANDICDMNPERVLVLLRRQVAIEEYLGKRGSDMFRLIVGPAFANSMGALYEKMRTQDKLQLATHTMAAREMKKGGMLDPDIFELIIVDEAHGALADGLGSALRRVDQARLHMFTATPYNAKDKLSRQYPCHEEVTLRQAVVQGIVSPVELHAYRARNEPRGMAKMIARLALLQLSQGLTVAAICKPGGMNAEAVYVAGLINEAVKDGLVTPHESLGWKKGTDIVKLVSSYEAHKVSEFFRMFDEGDISGLIGVNMLDESWDPYRLGSLIHPLTKSERLTKQRIGRALRLGEQITKLIEVFPHTIPKLRTGRPYSMFEAFEETDMINGLVIASPWVKHPGSSGRGGGRSGQIRAPNPQDWPFFGNLEGDVIPNQRLRYVLVAPEDLHKIPPEGHLSLDYLCEKYEDIPRRLLEIILDTAVPAIESGGYYFSQTEGEGRQRRFYDPIAEAFLEANPPSQRRFTPSEVALFVGMEKAYLEKHMHALPSVAPHIVPGEEGYSIAATVAIDKEVKKIPVATTKDIPLPDLGRELVPYFVQGFVSRPYNNVTVYLRRRNPDLTFDKRLQVIVEAIHTDNAARVRQAFLNPDVATDAHMSIVAIANKAEVSYGVAKNAVDRLQQLPPEERPEIFQLRTGSSGRNRNGAHVLREVGEKVVAQLKRYPLGAHEATNAMVSTYFGRTPTTMSYWTGKVAADPAAYELTPEEATITRRILPYQNNETDIVSWRVVWALERHAGLLPGGEVEIDYRHTASHADVQRSADTGPGNKDRQERLAYGKQLHALLQRPSKAARQSDAPPALEEPKAASQPEDAAPVADVLPVEPEESSAATSGESVDNPSPPADPPPVLRHEYEKVRRDLRFEANAFRRLVQALKFPESQVTRAEDGSITDFSPEALGRITHHRSRTGVVEGEKWVRLGKLAEMAQHSPEMAPHSLDEAYQVLSEIEQAGSMPFGDRQLRLGSVNRQIELYLDLELAKRVRRTLEDPVTRARVQQLIREKKR